MSGKDPKPVDLAELRKSIEHLKDRPNATVIITARWITELINRVEAAEAHVASVRELASPDWCLSVPAGVKHAILARTGGGA